MASISSITSKYASLLVYLTPNLLQGIFDNCPVGKVELTLSNEIEYSVAKGKPLSNISSRSS
ncbi:hypothetical protein QR98_0006230 [Sarcoptes scabiei]|uniref:Uncharacterized protein n=1 Tax=Sarcoptes scabiei TaxID=52283 RepID=A0A131ZU09_SARSC|nr:hypothetical protein QR98_0006230 [Sarcoptes scabiei]